MRVALPLLAALLAAPLAAAQDRAEARVDASVVGVEDTLELTVSVPERRGGAPELPPLPGFEVLGSRTLSSTQVVNGEVTRSVSWIYRLRPLEVGAFEIPPIAVPGYQPSAPVAVAVESGSRRPARRQRQRPDPFGSVFGRPFDPLLDPFTDPFGTDPPPEVGAEDLFVRAEVSAPDVAVGEQVLVLYRLYARVPVFTAVPVELAQPEGFWVEEIPLPDVPWQEQGLSRAQIRERRARPGPRRDQREVDGRTYETYPLLLRAVFPTGAGERELPGPRFEIGVPGRTRSLFLAPTTVAAREAPAVTIRSTPLPEAGRPPGFSGAVGAYRLDASVLRDGAPLGDDPVPAGEPLVLRLELEGEGNIEAAGMPEFGGDSGFRRAFRFFDPESSLETGLTEVGGGVGLDAFRFGGRRIWEFPVVPEAGGTHEIATASLDVFDPSTGGYRTVASDALPIRVEGGIVAVPAPTGSGTIERLGEDIRYLRPVGPAPAAPPAPWDPFRGAWWVAFSLGLPVVWNLAVFAALRRRRYRAAHADRFRRQGAAREALRRLGRVRAGDAGAQAEIGAALADYAAARLGASARGLTPEGAADRLAAEGADPAAAREFAALLSRTQAAGYAAAPAASTDLASPEQAADLVRRLETRLRRPAV